MICLYKPHDLHCDWMQCREINRDILNDVVANPSVIPNKADVPLVIFGEPVASPEMNKYGKMRCIGANVEFLYAFCLDFDNGITIAEFENTYKKYSYILYTSYSYGIKPGDRFRVILPLAYSFPVRWLACPSIKSNLLWQFQGVDSTCFDRGHWQKLPAISRPDAKYYCNRNYGKTFGVDTNAWEVYHGFYDTWVDNLKKERELREQRLKGTTQAHDGAIRHCQEIIDQTQEGERDKTLFRLLSWLHEIGCSDAEAAQLRVWNGFEETLYEKIRRIWR